MTLKKHLTHLLVRMDEVDALVNELLIYLDKHTLKNDMVLGTYIDVEDRLLEIHEDVIFDEELTQLFKSMNISDYRIGDTYFLPLPIIVEYIERG